MAARLALLLAFVSALPADTAPARERTRDAAHRRDGVPASAPLPLPRPVVGPALRSWAPEPDRDRPDPALKARAQCWKRLVSDLAVADPEPAIDGPGACGASDLVSLKAIRLPGGDRVVLEPAAKVRCGMAEALARWVRADIAPVLERSEARLARLQVSTSYECRPRNRVESARTSEHGTGNAVDVRALVLTDGKTVVLTDATDDKDLRSALATSACARFSTVLGPGSDPSHEDHIHLDLIERRSGSHICQWNVR
ncbi:MAG TPA: extensin family protein [Casimicrobiaceae bacterium]|nr:extensin family protein [Casimicrobiaceae bacterium]